MARRPPVYRLTPLLLAAGLLALPACESGGHFCVLGYTTRPNYDTSIHTVYVPIFQNRTFWKGLEFEVTKAVVREIEAKTPYKVVSDCSEADTELRGTIISYNKNLLNRNQLNEVREAETTLGVEVVWRNLRTGEVLSQTRAPGAIAPAIPIIPAPGNLPEVAVPLPPPPPPPPSAPPTLVQSIGGFIPELGQSLATAQQQNANRLATQIVSMMEKPW